MTGGRQGIGYNTNYWVGNDWIEEAHINTYKYFRG
jgi:hypothetical protein